MAQTLADLSKIETDILRKSVYDTLIMESNTLELLPWESIGAIATTIVRIQNLPSVAFRMLNEGYAENTGKLEQLVENVYPLGVMLDTDVMIARAKNTIGDARAIQQTLGLKAMAYHFNDMLINGDPALGTNQFKGLSKRVDQLRVDGFDNQYINNAGTSGDGILLSTAERNNFLNKLDQLLYSINGHNPDFLFMNKKMLLALRSLLRQEKLLDTTRDMFDRRVDTYQGARLIDIGVKADQTTEIITNVETLEAAGEANSTSIYAVKFGIGTDFWGIQQYPMDIKDKGELEAKPVYRTQIDWPLGLALTNPRSIARLFAIIPTNET